MPTPNPRVPDLYTVFSGQPFAETLESVLRPGRMRSRVLMVILVLIVALFLKGSFVLVGAGERAVIFNRFTGTQHYQLGEGLHLVTPGVELPVIYDIKSSTYTMSGSPTESNPQAGTANDALTALTADGLPVILELSIRFHIDPDNVWRLHQEIGPDYVGKVVRPQTSSYVRMVIAHYPVIDVYGSRRAQITDDINTRLRAALAQNYLVLDEALLRDVSFSADFQKAIEQKQVAQQEVARMDYVLDQADKERKRKIIEAEGEAASIRLKAAALQQNPQLVQYEYVKNLPDNVRTVIAGDRTIINLGDNSSAGPAAAAAQPTPAPTPEPAPADAGQ